MGQDGGMWKLWFSIVIQYFQTKSLCAIPFCLRWYTYETVQLILEVHLAIWVCYKFTCSRFFPSGVNADYKWDVILFFLVFFFKSSSQNDLKKVFSLSPVPFLSSKCRQLCSEWSPNMNAACAQPDLWQGNILITWRYSWNFPTAFYIQHCSYLAVCKTHSTKLETFNVTNRDWERSAACHGLSAITD